MPDSQCRVRGSAVPQNANDEPASVLLERIRTNAKPRHGKEPLAPKTRARPRTRRSHIARVRVTQGILSDPLFRLTGTARQPAAMADRPNRKNVGSRDGR